MSKKALIDPNVTDIKYISGYTQEVIDDVTVDVAIYSTYPNSQRVAQVEDTEFEVASPLFWVDCSDAVVPDLWYYDTSDSTIKEVVNAVPAS
jgi:hypothetical protein